MLTKIGFRWINSVLKLEVVQAHYNPIKPYKDPQDITVTGSGFIIDLEKGLVVTTARLCKNPTTIIGKSFRTGQRCLELELLSVCREKDLALCKLNHEDIELITRGIKKEEIEKLNFKFGDSFRLNIGEESVNMSFTHNSVEFISTTILDFIHNIGQTEDSSSRLPPYIRVKEFIQGTGGVLLNMSGKIIGIQSKNDKFVSSRSLLSIFPQLLNTSEVKLPSLSLDWCKTNREIMKLITGSSSTYGIYVRKVGQDSCFDKFERGDIIKRIDFEDRFWNSQGESNEEAFLIPNAEKSITTTLVTALLDRFGMTYQIGTLKDPAKYEDMEKFEKVFSVRSLSLDELMDIIPINTNIGFNLCRNGQWFNGKSVYKHVVSDRIVSKDKLDYEIFAGLCCCNLSQEHIKIFDLNEDESQVVITHTFPESTNGKIGILKPGFIVKSILGYDKKGELIKDSYRPIKELEDVRHVLRIRPDQLQITTTDNSVLFLKTSTIIREDRTIMNNHHIRHNYLLGDI